MISCISPTSDPRSDRGWAIVVLGSVVLGAVLASVLLFPDGVTVSMDPGYRPMPVLVLLVPAMLCIAAALLLPSGQGSSAVLVTQPGRVRAQTAGLLALAVGFSLLVPVLPLPEDYVLLKALMFIVVPCVWLWFSARRHGAGVEIHRPSVHPAVVVLPALLLGILSTVGPFSSGSPTVWPPLATLVVGATATAITAGLGEELLFRRFLQTRLEALCGRWTGILLASLLFGLMHLFSHGVGPLGESAVRVIALQGTTGIALGVLWSRWRRLWVCVLAHVLLNGLGVVLHLLGQLA